MDNVAWLLVALAAVLAGVGGYVTFVLRREKRLGERLRELDPPAH